MAKSVVIVESPAKAKTINRYLGDQFKVLASFGHIRDLPSKNGSVDPNQDFKMIWELDEKSQKHIDEISKALKNADTLYLATDPDREGEAISWHVRDVLNENNSLSNKEVHRIVFNEITQKAIKQAIKKPRNIDSSLVDAYLARRALDYLVGFNLSPVLWRKLPGARSAGRVQSVALRIIVDREQEIENFKSQEYWSITAQFLAKKDVFSARLTHFHKEKLEKFSIPSSEKALHIVNTLKDLSFSISDIEKKTVKRSPAAPFITSTLQQEASRKLGFGASRTMQVAQKLYEGIEVKGEVIGLITYMRTDSINMAEDAIKEAREYLQKNLNESYIPSAPRTYKSKVKNAQEAHECIRPTSFFLTPEEVKSFLDEAQFKLYELIWKRALASQMENALFDQVSVDLTDTDKQHILRATGSTLVFDGFLRLYQEGKDEDDEENTNRLPVLEINQSVETKEIVPNQHFTQPPPRFTEASLVKKLEELGIGRPSTYATLLQTLQDRKYVRLEKRQFFPEDRGRFVTCFLLHYFPRYVEYDFTAHMEEELDEISSGLRPWKEVLATFWKDFKHNIDQTEPLKISEVIESLEKDLALLLFNGNEPEKRICPSCQKGSLSLKLSKYGSFLGCSNYPECTYKRSFGQGENAEEAIQEPEVYFIGKDPKTNVDIYLKKGPYGYYFEWALQEEKAEEPETTKKKKKKKDKPKRVALLTGMTPADATLDIALKLATLPLTLGLHPEDQMPIQLAVGRFGPYVKHGDLFASIPKSAPLFNVTLEDAVQWLEKKKNAPKRKTKKTL